ncbi:phosphoribosylamine--glycine ligase [Reichenbachiella faecimaris]|uniref:Phosphoribosylamine--glycine ligase n=1 Tax=Reichenbachiella faecimaris TaxID=692418 RepID=A0A1W2GCM4_REIFA|nr:phosphoribosylamine--glycine ligase [Reichenbachiella faecimaris]SMD34407.1 phosphoribosylamine--glycine ligase [Reichenbachiella faecimaris]
MNILVIGAGGREHALAWKIKQSPECNDLFVAPGNAGTRALAENLAIGVNDFEALGKAVLDKSIDLVIVGPEEPLVKGIRNYFASNEQLKNVLMVGPDEVGAQLEGSKDFSKAFMVRNNIPTAGSLTVTASNLSEGLDFLKKVEAPYVLKADGLAAGKGVIITSDIKEAEDSLKEMLDGQFGAASSKVLIEEYLHGIELSVFVLTDGKSYMTLPEAKDYKRIGEGDTGPNTGGMGAVSPVSFADETFMKKVEDKVIRPTVGGLQADGIDFIGFLFIGLMNVNGEPYVIEYNVRMGDPETEVVMPRIQSDMLSHLTAAAKGELDKEQLAIKPETATTVVAVAEGYPGSYEKGRKMTGLDQAFKGIVFHAGTAPDGDQVVTNGGRVIASTGLGSDIQSALDQSYENLQSIQWEGMNFRKDIGQDLLSL